MPQNNWYKGYCFRTRLHIMPYTFKRWWEAFWNESTGEGSANVTLIAISETSLKDLRQKARLWIELDIKKKQRGEIINNAIENKDFCTCPDFGQWSSWIGIQVK